jgi:hypothetical protein
MDIVGEFALGLTLHIIFAFRLMGFGYVKVKRTLKVCRRLRIQKQMESHQITEQKEAF